MIYTFIILQECQSWQSSLVILQGNSNRETLNVLREMDDDVRIENEIYDISSVQVDDGISFLQVGWRNTPDLYDLKCWFKFLNFYPCCSLLLSSASLAPSWDMAESASVSLLLVILTLSGDSALSSPVLLTS